MNLIRSTMMFIFASSVSVAVEAAPSINVKASELKNPKLVQRLLSSGGSGGSTTPSPQPQPTPPPLEPIRQAKARIKGLLIHFEKQTDGSWQVTLKSNCENKFDIDVFDSRGGGNYPPSKRLEICDLEVEGQKGKLNAFATVNLMNQDIFLDGQHTDVKTVSSSFYWVQDVASPTSAFKYGWNSTGTKDMNQKSFVFGSLDQTEMKNNPDSYDKIYLIMDIED